MTSDTLIKTIIIEAPRETVWEYLTKKEHVAKWFQKLDEDLSLNAPYELYKDTAEGTRNRLCWGQVQTMIPPEELTYTFTVTPLNGAMTTVSWLLEEVADATKLTLKHEGIVDAAGDAGFGTLIHLDMGWDEHLKTLRAECAE